MERVSSSTGLARADLNSNHAKWIKSWCFTIIATLELTMHKRAYLVVFFLTCEYVRVSGCDSFDLDNARLCSLKKKKRKADIYNQCSICPSKDAPLRYWCWTQSLLRWPQGRKHPAPVLQGNNQASPAESFGKKKRKKKKGFPQLAVKVWRRWEEMSGTARAELVNQPTEVTFSR